MKSPEAKPINKGKTLLKEKTLKTSCLVIIVATLLFVSAVAEDEENKCCCTTYDASVCLSKVHDKLDAHLDETYRETLSAAKRYIPQDEDNLKDAQQKWISYRDAACKAERGLWGNGSGASNAWAICMIKITRRRITDLKNAYLEH